MVTKREWGWTFRFAVLALILTTIPYLIGYQRQGADWRYSGFIFGVDDGNSYLAKMLRGANGDWLFRSPYTAYPQSGFLAFLPYILLGKLTASPGQHDQLAALFHLFRWGAGILMVLATYDFISMFVEDVRWRRFGTALATLGGGLGWLSVLGLGKLWGGPIPLEFYSPESFGFLSLFGLPHLALGRSLLLWGLKGFLTAKNARGGIRPGLMWLALGFVQPLTVVTGWAVIAATMGISTIMQVSASRRWKRRLAASNDPNPTQPRVWQGWWRRARVGLITGLISSPMVISTFIAFQVDPYLQAWGKQNLILSPPPGDYLLAYAAILPFVIMGIPSLVNSKLERSSLLIGWLVVFPILAYAPYNLQRRLPDGIWVALVVLGMVGMLTLASRWKKIAIAWLSFSFIPAVILIAGGALTVWVPKVPLFIPVKQVQVFEYLAGHGKRDAVVLASFETSNQLPAWAQFFTVTGHGPESMNASEIQPEVSRFFTPGVPDENRLAFIRKFHIQYVIYGPSEVDLGSRSPAESPFMKLFYQNQDYLVYEYQP